MSKLDKKQARLRRAKKIRAKMRELNVHRVSVYRSAKHIYAQLLSPCGGKVITSASTLDKDLKAKIKSSGNKTSAKLVGELLAKRTLEAGVKKVAFDRSGYQYNGRVKALAEAAREGGIEF
jgi:large subunit ribosomal protein L18